MSADGEGIANADGSKNGGDAELPAIDFITFVLSLHHSVLMHLGAAPDPTTGARSKNLTLAKQTIDLLGLLQEKTRSNLAGAEDRTLEEVLYELRLSYVEAVKSK